MVIYNTTYHVSQSVAEDFLDWLRREYIPVVISGGELSLPQLTCIITDDPEAEGNSYALQFHALSVEALEIWYRRTGAHLLEEMTKRFGQDVAGFSTLMEKLDIDI